MLHQVGVSFDLYYDARKYKFKKTIASSWLFDFLSYFFARYKNENVEYYSKNKFEKLVHLVGFIIRVYHDARSAELQIHIILIMMENVLH